MSNYVKSTNFTAKDSLPTGNSGKIVKGAELDTEYTAIASAISSKADINSPAFTGTPTGPTAGSGTNTTQLATTAFATAAAASAFPSGGIIMWSGSIVSIPSGWNLCDGTNSTPDLRNRFIVGAGSTYAVAATGGSADALTVAHTHTFTGTSNSTGDHQHVIPIQGGNGSVNSANSLVGDIGQRQGAARYTETAGAHSHTVSGTTASTGSSGTNANLPPYYALAYIMKA